MTLYTGVGDRGETALFDGTLVPKFDRRVAAYGDVDELNAVIGVGIAAGVERDLSELLGTIQRDLFALGARLADPEIRIATRVTKTELNADDVRRLEIAIDHYDGAVAPLRHFLLPGGSPAAAALHHARAVCRRAERSIVALGADTIPKTLLQYINRLSDLLFVVARVLNHRHNVAEQEW